MNKKITAYDWINSNIKSEDLFENSLKEIEKKSLKSFLLSDKVFEENEDLLEKYNVGLLSENYSDLRTKDSCIFENLVALNETKHVLLRIEDLCEDIIKKIHNYDLTKLNQNIKLESPCIEKIEEEFHIEFELYYSLRTNQQELAKIWKLDKKSYLITIAYSSFRNKQELREAISHELVHLVEQCITDVKPSYIDVDENENSAEYFVDNFLYVFSKQEINARLTELYYALHDTTNASDIELVRKELEKKVNDFKTRSENAFGYITSENTPKSEMKLSQNYWKVITLYDKMISLFYVLEKFTTHDKKVIVKIFRDRAVTTNRNPFNISPKGNPLEDFEKIRRKSEKIVKAYTRKIRGVLSLLNSPFENV